MGMMASGEGVWPEKGYVPGKDRGGGLMGRCQLARGAWVGSAHLDTLWTSVDRRFSSFPPGYLQSAVPKLL